MMLCFAPSPRNKRKSVKVSIGCILLLIDSCKCKYDSAFKVLLDWLV